MLAKSKKQFQLFIYRKQFNVLVKRYMNADSEKKKELLSQVEDLFSKVYLVGEMAIPLEMEIREFVVRERKLLKSVEQRPMIGMALRAFIEQREGKRIGINYTQRPVGHRQISRKLIVGKTLHKKR